MNYIYLPRKTSKGFSLIETLVYFSILAVILLIVVDLFFRVTDASLEGSAKSSIEIEGEYVLNRMAYDVHRTDLNGSDTLIVPVNSGDTTPWLGLRIQGKNYVYVAERLISPSGSSIIFAEFGVVADRLTSNSVRESNLTFTNVTNAGGKPTIKVNFTLESTETLKNGASESKDFETVLSFR